MVRFSKRIMETKENKIIQMRRKANRDFRINRPYGIRLNMKSKSYALFNREFNALGKDESCDLNSLPSEPYDCIEDIPLDLAHSIQKNGDIIDLYFYDEQTSPFSDSRIDAKLLLVYNKKMFELSGLLDRAL